MTPIRSREIYRNLTLYFNNITFQITEEGLQYHSIYNWQKLNNATFQITELQYNSIYGINRSCNMALSLTLNLLSTYSTSSVDPGFEIIKLSLGQRQYAFILLAGFKQLKSDQSHAKELSCGICVRGAVSKFYNL